MNLIDIFVMLLFGIGVVILCFGSYIYYNRMTKSYDKLENIFTDFGNNIKIEIENYYKKEEKK